MSHNASDVHRLKSAVISYCVVLQKFSDHSQGSLPPFSGHKSKERGNMSLQNARKFLPKHIETLPKEGSHLSHHLQNTMSYFYIWRIGFHKNHPASDHIVAMFHKLLRSSVNIWLASGRSDTKIIIALPVEAIHYFLLRSVQTGGAIYAATCHGQRVTSPGGNATEVLVWSLTLMKCRGKECTATSLYVITTWCLIAHRDFQLLYYQYLKKGNFVWHLFLNHFLRFPPSFL
jgi:hypothetical protein